MAIKGYFTFPNDSALLEPHHQIVKCHIQDTSEMQLVYSTALVYWANKWQEEMALSKRLKVIRYDILVYVPKETYGWLVGFMVCQYLLDHLMLKSIHFLFFSSNYSVSSKQLWLKVIILNTNILHTVIWFKWVILMAYQYVWGLFYAKRLGNYIQCMFIFTCIRTHLYDVKYSDLIQIICKQLYGFKYPI